MTFSSSFPRDTDGQNCKIKVEFDIGILGLYSMTEMGNYFPGAFFTLVPINPNPVDPSLIRVKTQPQT